MSLKDELKKALLEKHPVISNIDDWVLVRCNAYMRSMSDIGYLRGTLSIADMKNSRIFSPFSHGIFCITNVEDVTVIENEKDAKAPSFNECVLNAMSQISPFFDEKRDIPKIIYYPSGDEEILILEFESVEEAPWETKFLKIHFAIREEIEVVIDGYQTCNKSHLAVFDLKNFGIKMGNVSVIRKFKYEA